MSPSKLTPKTQERIYQAIRAGNYKETACKFAGISAPTFYRWVKQGRQDLEDGDERSRCAVFVLGLDEAIAGAEVHNVAIIQTAAKKHWQASAWMLERRHPERWSRNEKQRIEMRAEVDVNDSSSKDKLKSLLDGIADRLRESPGAPDDDGTGGSAGTV